MTNVNFLARQLDLRRIMVQRKGMKNRCGKQVLQLAELMKMKRVGNDAAKYDGFRTPVPVYVKRPKVWIQHRVL